MQAYYYATKCVVQTCSIRLEKKASRAREQWFAVAGGCLLLLLLYWPCEGSNRAARLIRGTNVSTDIITMSQMQHGGAQPETLSSISDGSQQHTLRSHGKQTATSTSVQQWAEFWASDTRKGIEALQSLREQVSYLQYQHSATDKRSLNTTWLDMVLPQTQLQETQAWLRGQVTAAVLDLIHALQHPSNCTAARRLVCVLNKDCGFGCEMHHAVHCLTHAVALNRTLVLVADGWRYAPGQDGQKAWQKLLMPVSSCSKADLTKKDNWQGVSVRRKRQHLQEVAAGSIEVAATDLDPPAMPPDVLELARLFSSRPEAWWVGVLASFLLRPVPALARAHAEYKQQWGWHSPIAGVHIRRTDKVTKKEARAFEVHQYMQQVDKWCDHHFKAGWRVQARAGIAEQHASPDGLGTTLAPKSTFETKAAHLHQAQSQMPQSAAVTCSIYLATDEPSVVANVKAGYPHIQVIINPDGVATGMMNTRWSQQGLAGIVNDLLLLSSTNFLVGTFSSHVSRLAYELAQVRGGEAGTPALDPSLNYYSLDSMWYFGGMRPYELCSSQDYTSGGKLVVKAGQHLSCGTMLIPSAGMLPCCIVGESTARNVTVPPAILRRCHGSVMSSYRNVLPVFMRQPAATAAAGARGASAPVI